WVNESTLVSLLVEHFQTVRVHFQLNRTSRSLHIDKLIATTVISIIIPVYNEESTIGVMLESLKDCGADEVLVADGGSLDRTVEIASGHARIVHAEIGRATQMNAAA